MFVTLIPAYGRTYKNKSQVMADWNADKDFIVQCMMHPADGKPINKSQVTTEKIQIRYGKNNTKSMNVN